MTVTVTGPLSPHFKLSSFDSDISCFGDTAPREFNFKLKFRVAHLPLRLRLGTSLRLTGS